jgi:hypothetical protein
MVERRLEAPSPMYVYVPLTERRIMLIHTITRLSLSLSLSFMYSLHCTVPDVVLPTMSLLSEIYSFRAFSRL